MAFKCNGTQKECQDALLGILSIIEACKPGDHAAAWRALGAIREAAHHGLLGRDEWARWIVADAPRILVTENFDTSSWVPLKPVLEGRPE